MVGIAHLWSLKRVRRSVAVLPMHSGEVGFALSDIDYTAGSAGEVLFDVVCSTWPVGFVSYRLYVIHTGDTAFAVTRMRSWMAKRWLNYSSH